MHLKGTSSTYSILHTWNPSSLACPFSNNYVLLVIFAQNTTQFKSTLLTVISSELPPMGNVHHGFSDHFLSLLSLPNSDPSHLNLHDWHSSLEPVCLPLSAYNSHQSYVKLINLNVFPIILHHSFLLLILLIGMLKFNKVLVDSIIKMHAQ